MLIAKKKIKDEKKNGIAESEKFGLNKEYPEETRIIFHHPSDKTGITTRNKLNLCSSYGAWAIINSWCQSHLYWPLYIISKNIYLVKKI
ncbi:hypothetical protein BpHYR1_032583 [Brachionus plicatilis]|uniref:Uncharacterized protein n=1 Tax=Brachionus plicatilis TaxID=10195 RepID=A0A3M7QKI9_BRAPC|nr:hypothetical protein BpHYR1_032583 [Brachionus plicatilis]